MLCLKGIIIASIIQTSLAVWSCSVDQDCSDLDGSVCLNGDCVCPAGQQQTSDGARCVDLAPYHTSPCLENHQCSRLFTAFECRRAESEEEGTCVCQPGHHYFLGRCWPTIGFGEPCTRNEECLGIIRDPFSMNCNGTCQCADGYFERQRGECRRIARDIGEGCVLDSDCQFEGGYCDINNFTCYNNADAKAPHRSSKLNTRHSLQVENNTTMVKSISRSVYSRCPCEEPFQCFMDTCVCPVGYYFDGTTCLAELGSPASDPEMCTGLLAAVIDGICTCPPNFFFDENMRDCIRVTRRITESCVNDANCHTFGVAARCGEPGQWGLRTCECIPEEAVWDNQRQICRLFAGIGESCQLDSDCLAGELEIQCVVTDGQGFCACPEGLTEVDGLCLTTGLYLGDECQATVECTETPNTVCEDGRCSCDSSGYQEIDGACAPIIGGVCEANEDCVIENTVCVNSTEGITELSTCQCDRDFVEYEEVCWPVTTDHGGYCNVTAQCTAILGQSSACVNGLCACIDGHHFRDGGCWPMIGLFESCSRLSECYLSDRTDRTVCRNGLCQCAFDFPYDERSHTCNRTDRTVCRNGLCQCAFDFPYDERSHTCSLFESCSRLSECYLSDRADRTVCRNGLCQCAFDFPYDERSHTCTDAATGVYASLTTITVALIYLSSLS